MMWQDFVSSSNIEWIGYKPEQHQLFVGFLNGSVYVYYSVPEAVATKFRHAGSKGRFHHQNIRGLYTFDQLQ